MNDMKMLIKLIEKLCKVEDREFDISDSPHRILHKTFEQQGVKKVIKILEGISNGDIKPKDYLD